MGREPAVRTGLVTQDDWRTCADPEPLLHFLRDRGSIRKWRLFAVACCLRIGPLITDERSRRAVEVAARHADGAATEEELEAARSAAQQAQDEAKDAEYAAEAEANFSTTPGYAAVCCRLYAAAAARSAVGRDPRMTDAERGTFEADYWQPSQVRAVHAVSDSTFASFDSDQGDSWWEEARRAAEAVSAAELGAHCELLRDLFGEYLGPPGREGAWLPSGSVMVRPPLTQTEQWCLLPTPRSLILRPEWLAWQNGTIPRLAEAIYAEEAFDRLPFLADALEEAGCTDTDILDHCRAGGVHFRGCWVVDLLRGNSEGAG
jgi:hypothetical protein